jgi:hypothetical protein
MSEELSADVKEETKEAPKEAPKFSLDDWHESQEAKASSAGWQPFDDFIEGGGDPDKWRDASAFNTYGELIGTVKKQAADFESRLEGVTKLGQAQLAAQRQTLIKERDEAIENGQVKAVHAIDQQLHNLNQPVQPQRIAELEQWNADNPWIMDKSPKAIYARAIWGDLLAQNMPVGQALAALEGEVKKNFPPPPRQTHVPDSEKGRVSAGLKSRTAALTMADVTQQELNYRKALPDAWASDKEFLQAVADNRKAEGAK